MAPGALDNIIDHVVTDVMVVGASAAKARIIRTTAAVRTAIVAQETQHIGLAGVARVSIGAFQDMSCLSFAVIEVAVTALTPDYTAGGPRGQVTAVSGCGFAGQIVHHVITTLGGGELPGLDWMTI